MFLMGRRRKNNLTKDMIRRFIRKAATRANTSGAPWIVKVRHYYFFHKQEIYILYSYGRSHLQSNTGCQLNCRHIFWNGSNHLYFHPRNR
jgi:hypothetical protein